MTSPNDDDIILNLPRARFKITRCVDGIVRIHDRLRRKDVALTPEEWVRQHFVNYLVSCLGYPSGLMANEVTIRLNRTSKRCDTVVYSRDGQPLMVVEYKAPSVKVTQGVFDQAARYNTVVGARYLAVSNGVSHYCCRFDGSDAGYSFLRAIPRYEELDQNR